MSKPALQAFVPITARISKPYMGYMHPYVTAGPVDILLHGIFAHVFGCNSQFSCFCLFR